MADGTFCVAALSVANVRLRCKRGFDTIGASPTCASEGSRVCALELPACVSMPRVCALEGSKPRFCHFNDASVHTGGCFLGMHCGLSSETPRRVPRYVSAFFTVRSTHPQCVRSAREATYAHLATGAFQSHHIYFRHKKAACGYPDLLESDAGQICVRVTSIFCGACAFCLQERRRLEAEAILWLQKPRGRSWQGFEQTGTVLA